MSKVFLNGQFVEETQAKVSVFDHGFLYGDGIFETLRAYSGRIFRLEDHVSRLLASADRICLSLPWSRDELKGILNESLRVNNYRDAVLRITVSRGVGPAVPDPDLCVGPTLVVLARPFAGYPEARYETGLRAALLATRKTHARALDPSIKSSNFLNNILARLEAKRAGADEGIFLNQEGFLAEGTVSNLFFAARGVLCTPSLSCGILAGISRSVVLELAAGLGIPVKEDLFPPGSLDAADEIFLTNTTYEIMPVRALDARVLEVGPLTQKIRRAFHNRVLSETAAD